MNRIVFFGCSHTNRLFHELSLNENKETFLDFSVSGNSNAKIMWDVYQFIKSNDYNPQTDILSIQYTYTNRWWVLNHLPRNEASFHSFKTNIGIYGDLPKSIETELNTFYQTYIKYFWNYDTSLQSHIMEIEKLKAFLDVNNVKYIHWAWTDGGNTDEWNTNKIFKNNDGIDSEVLFKNLGCEEIDGHYLIRKVGDKNNFLMDCDHFNHNGNIYLFKWLSNTILKKFNFNLNS
jgi:hypothetical protein